MRVKKKDKCAVEILTEHPLQNSIENKKEVIRIKPGGENQILSTKGGEVKWVEKETSNKKIEIHTLHPLYKTESLEGVNNIGMQDGPQGSVLVSSGKKIKWHTFDHKTIFHSSGSISAPGLLSCFPYDVKIMQDFDFNITYREGVLHIETDDFNMYNHILIKDRGKSRYIIKPSKWEIEPSSIDLKGNYATILLEAYIVNDLMDTYNEVTSSIVHRVVSHDDMIPKKDIQPGLDRINLISIILDRNTLQKKKITINDLVIIKHWKNNLAPFDQLMDNWSERSAQ